MCADFTSEYGIRLEREDVPWREFRRKLIGLLACNSRLWRHFSPEPDDPEGGPGEW